MLVKINIKETLNLLLMQEDTDGDKKITIEDNGPKEFILVSESGENIIISETYYLSNLLQELILVDRSNAGIAEINTDYIFEKPVDRLNRMIKDYYWDGLTRKLDKDGLIEALFDEKMPNNELFLYVPSADKEALKYYKEIASSIKEIPFTVIELPQRITPDYVYSINDKSGVVSLGLNKNENDDIEALPFVVPGGRFNEMYGWDSYFESLGLIIDGRLDLAKSMVENFEYEIKHYGQILNANRTYYLTRSQPPFLTSFVQSVYDNLSSSEKNKNWLSNFLNTCIKEYKTVWTSNPKLTENGLSRYYGNGIGLPPETEEEHFDTLLEKFAIESGITVREYHKKYLAREIIEPEIEEYIIHDRSIRESGHDTSYRLDKISASLNTVDLNSLLYKYEIDIANFIKKDFDDLFLSENGEIQTSSDWLLKADLRKKLINDLMWNPSKGFFFDYNFEKEEQNQFESATTLYPLWAKIATQEQADLIVEKAIPLLEFTGGIAGSSKESVGIISESRPQKQWDYPNGWAPHQILIWEGLSNYGYDDITTRLAYKWLYLIIKNAVDFNGTIPEKYDVVSCTHKVFAEYGNVGTQFDYITKEGFGWMNASFKIGQKYLSDDLIEKLNELTPPQEIF